MPSAGNLNGHRRKLPKGSLPPLPSISVVRSEPLKVYRETRRTMVEPFYCTECRYTPRNYLHWICNLPYYGPMYDRYFCWRCIKEIATSHNCDVTIMKS